MVEKTEMAVFLPPEGGPAVLRKSVVVSFCRYYGECSKRMIGRRGEAEHYGTQHPGYERENGRVWSLKGNFWYLNGKRFVRKDKKYAGEDAIRARIIEEEVAERKFLEAVAREGSKQQKIAAFADIHLGAIHRI